MQQLVGYHRPRTVGEAVELLSAPNTMALAGGTTVRHDAGAEPVDLVDLQSLGLGLIEVTGDVIELGATATLQDVVDAERAPELIRRCARAELPSTLRTLATIGGTIGAGDRESLLLAALLVHDAFVRFADGRSIPLAEVLDADVAPGSLIVAIIARTGGSTAFAATGRTPADTPIVAAVARSAGAETRVALTGVATTPVLVEPDAIDSIEPPADFRGSSDYRHHLARVLSERALEELR